jgi:hypothetical protein
LGTSVFAEVITEQVEPTVASLVVAHGTVVGKLVSETVAGPGPPGLGVLFLSVIRSAWSSLSSPA